MNSTRLRIPGDFFYKKYDVSWFDIAWAFEFKILNWETVVDIATQQAAERKQSPEIEELSWVTRSNSEEVGEVLKSIRAKTEGIPKVSSDKWLFLMLLYMYENRSTIPDPLELVEIIYADFEYPPEIEKLVRYMPMLDGENTDLKFGESSIDRLFRHWEDYLSDRKQLYKIEPRLV